MRSGGNLVYKSAPDGKKPEKMRNHGLCALAGILVGQSGGTRWREVEDGAEGHRRGWARGGVAFTTRSWRPEGTKKERRP